MTTIIAKASGKEPETHFALSLDDELFACIADAAREQGVEPFTLCKQILREGLEARQPVER